MEVPGILFGAGMLAVLLVLWTGLKKAFERSKQTRHTWWVFANSKGLREENPGLPIVSRFLGSNQGYPFVLERLRKRRGNSQQTFTRMHLALPDLPAGLRIHRQTPLGKLATALGAQDIETGIDGFDRTFTVKGNDPEHVRRFLTPDRRHAIMSSSRALANLRILDDGLYWERRGALTDPDELERLYTSLGELATALSRS